MRRKIIGNTALSASIALVLESDGSEFISWFISRVKYEESLSDYVVS